MTRLKDWCIIVLFAVGNRGPVTVSLDPIAAPERFAERDRAAVVVAAAGKSQPTAHRAQIDDLPPALPPHPRQRQPGPQRVHLRRDQPQILRDQRQMVLIELAVMGSMYANKKANLAIGALSVVALAGGYARKVEDTVAIHMATIEEAAAAAPASPTRREPGRTANSRRRVPPPSRARRRPIVPRRRQPRCIATVPRMPRAPTRMQTRA